MEKFNQRQLPRWAVYLLFGLLCLAVLVVLRIIRPQTLRTSYSLNFPDIYKSSPTVEIAGFYEGESWNGKYTLDSERSIDGETGMNMFSLDAKPAKVTLSKHLNLKPYESVFAYVYVSSNDYAQNIQSLSLQFGDSKNNLTAYQLSGLKAGWNYIRMKMIDFKPQGKVDTTDIQHVTVELVSRKGQNTQISMDRIWAQQSLRTGDFAKVAIDAVNLKTVGRKTYLHLSSDKPVSTYFNKMTSSSRFSYTVSVSSLKFGTCGLSFLADPHTGDGYYFLVSGKQMNEWYLLKKTNGQETEVKRGTLPPNTFISDAVVWLRVDKDGGELSFSYTIDGQHYLPIAKVKDSTFYKGNFGILTTGSYLIDSVDVKE